MFTEVFRFWTVTILVLVAIDLIVGRWWWSSSKERRYDPLILQASLRYQIDPALVKAVIWKESGFEPKARGRAGEIGLMQIRSLAAHEWAAAEKVPGFRDENLADPSINTLAGSWYLSKLLKRYRQTDNPIPYALADYNAGRSHVLRWKTGVATTNNTQFRKQVSFPSTQLYIQQVLERHQHYRAKTFAKN